MFWRNRAFNPAIYVDGELNIRRFGELLVREDANDLGVRTTFLIHIGRTQVSLDICNRLVAPTFA
jgi:hypothetical protein